MGVIRIRVAAFVTRDDSVLLVEHQRGPRHYWLPPGGGVEEGETLAEALRREIHEETGLSAHVREIILVTDSIEPRGRHVLNIIFRTAVDDGPIRVGVDGRLVGAQWVPKEDLLNLTIYPPVGEALLARWDDEPPRAACYLGNTWTEWD